jgi:hypothetical protein
MARWLLTRDETSWETVMAVNPKLSRATASTIIGWRETKGRTAMVDRTQSSNTSTSTYLYLYYWYCVLLVLCPTGTVSYLSDCRIS